MFTGGIIGIILGTLMTILLGGILFLIGYGTFHAANSWWVEPTEDEGVIIYKKFTPAHTTTTYVMVNKVMVPQVHYHDDQYTIWIEIGDANDDVNVTERYYNSASIGDKLNCRYKQGRFTDDIYIKDIW